MTWSRLASTTTRQFRAARLRPCVACVKRVFARPAEARAHCNRGAYAKHAKHQRQLASAGSQYFIWYARRMRAFCARCTYSRVGVRRHVGGGPRQARALHSNVHLTLCALPASKPGEVKRVFECMCVVCCVCAGCVYTTHANT